MCEHDAGPGTRGGREAEDFLAKQALALNLMKSKKASRASRIANAKDSFEMLKEMKSSREELRDAYKEYKECCAEPEALHASERKKRLHF